MMEAVDKADAAQFTESEILDPQGWILLSFLMDPRTGLGRFRDFRISNYELMMQLIDVCLERSVDEILAQPDVAERVELYREHAEARDRADPALLRRCTATSSCSTSATRRSSTRPTASWSTRCFPQCNISIHVLWGLRQQNTVFAVGQSIIDRSSSSTSAS